jgi:WD40 repeat protein
MPEVVWRDLRPVLDEELSRLPDKYRLPVVLCDLEGRTRREVARQLGVPDGTLSNRLATARRLLANRLRRRGLAPSGGAVAALLSQRAASADVPASLLVSTIKAATSATVKGVMTRTSSDNVVALSERVMRAMTRTKFMTTVLLTVGALVAGAGLLAHQAEGRTPGKPPSDAAPVRPAEGRDRPHLRRDQDGEPLPPEAIARLGTTHLRHGGMIDSLAFTPNGKTLVVCARGDGLRFWDTATGKESRRFPARIQAQSLALSPDGKFLAMFDRTTNPGDAPIALREFATGRLIRRFGQKGHYYSSLLFSPDGKALAAFRWAKSIDLWDPESGRLLHSLEGHKELVWAVAFSSDGKTLVSGSIDKTIRFWDVRTGAEVRQIKHSEQIGKLALSPDGKLLASVDMIQEAWPGGGGATWRPDRRVRLWDAESGKELRQLTMPAKEVFPGIRAGFHSLGFTPDGKALVTGDIVDGILRIWGPATGRELRRVTDFAGTVGPLAFAPDGKSVAVAHGNSSVRMIDLASGKDLVGTQGHDGSISSMVVTPDCQTIVTTGIDGTLRFWDAKKGRQLRQRSVSSRAILLPDGESYLDVGSDNQFRLYNLAAGKEQAVLRGHEAHSSFALSADHKRLASWGRDKTVRLLDPSTGKPSHTLLKVEKPTPGMAFTSDGRLLVIWAPDMTVTVWDAATGKQLRQFADPPQPGQVSGPDGSSPWYSAALSPDGSLLAFSFQALAIGQQPYLPVVETTTGKEVCRFKAGADGVDRLAFSPDGKSLAWGGWRDGTVYLGEIATGRERRHFTGHRSRILSLVFSTDGKILVSGTEDTSALVWDLTGRLAAANERDKPLSEEELQKHWTALASDDAAAGYRAVQALATDPVRAVPYLGKRLHPAAVADEKHLAQLIARLGSDRFEVRAKATAELEKLGEAALHALRKALDGQPALETRRRLEQLIDKQERERWSPSSDRLREGRALEVLERAGIPEARRVLDMLAARAPGARLTQDAQASLERLSSQPRR